MNEAFKVTVRASDGPGSYCGLAGLSLRYGIGIKTVPLIEGSKLFVFDTVENAIAFASRTDEDIGAQIWRCETGEQVSVGTLTNLTTLANVDDFWAGKTTPVRPAPLGTLGVDWVVLLEEIPYVHPHHIDDDEDDEWDLWDDYWDGILDDDD